MPAKKIETGVFIDLTRLVVTDLVRNHNPEAIISLAKNLQENQQPLQDIVVSPHDEAAGSESPLFDVLAGVDRKEAEESLGWEKAPCTILYGLSPYEKLKITLDENDERRGTGPLDNSRIFNAMLETDKDLTRDKLAARLGMTQNALSEYLSLMQLPSDVQAIIDRSTNLELRHVLQICRLITNEDQSDLAAQASERGFTIKQLTAEVNKRLENGQGQNAAVQQGVPLRSAAAKDPLAQVWRMAKKDPEIAGRGFWEASYGAQKLDQGHVVMGWTLSLSPVGEHPEVELAAWLRKLSNIIAATVDTGEMELASTSLLAVDPESSGWYKADAPESTIRLPQTAEEWSELKALAAASTGPGPVYAWIYGPGSHMTISTKSITWEDAEVTDPAAACEEIVKGVKSMSGAPDSGQA